MDLLINRLQLLYYIERDTPYSFEAMIKNMTGNNLVTDEQSARERMLRKVAQMRGLENDLATTKIENILVNLPTVCNVVESTGYAYGMPPHRMTRTMKKELTRVGQLFVEGSAHLINPDSYLNVGMDIFKCLVVDLGSQDYKEWSDYLENDLWRSQQLERRK